MKPPVPRLRYCHLNNEYSATCSNPPAAIPRNRTKSDRERSFSTLHFSKQIMLILEKPIQIVGIPIILQVDGVQQTKYLVYCSVITEIRHSWPHLGRDFKVLLSIHFEGNIKAWVSQWFQKASRANQKGTVTAKGTFGLPMMDDKTEKRQERREREMRVRRKGRRDGQKEKLLGREVSLYERYP